VTAAHSDEDSAADPGNDMMRLTAVHDHVEREAVKAFGPTVTQFQGAAYTPKAVPNGDRRANH
jgi:Na+-translocating ferredoxin:NAD+ oxidoreductase RnfG subunit